jgi:TIR domain
MVDFFISYERSDRDEAKRLVTALHAAKVSGWMDQTDLALSDSISSAIRDALKQSSVFVVLLSPRALHSQWVQFEIGAAEALGKKIVPVIVSGDHLEKQLPDILRDRKWIDARHRPHAEVVRDLKRALESTQ